MKKLEELLEGNFSGERVVAVAQAADRGILEVVREAKSRNLCQFLLVGEEKKIRDLADRMGLPVGNGVTIEDTTEASSAATAVQLVREGKADVLMKGHIETGTLMKQVLNKDYGLSAGRVLSHVALFDFPDYDRILFLTDSAMNISPGLNEKVQIVENAVATANRVGITRPKVAVLAAVEKVNPSMNATTDAALLTQMNRRKQLVGCTVDGPLAFDNAVNEEAATRKGIDSEVAGKADILLAPQIEVANALYKSFVYFGKAGVAGIIAGASSPVVLTSRADSPDNKLLSLALAVQEGE